MAIIKNFDNTEAIGGADYLFGGAKAKARKAARKVKKADKALEKGNVKKAERKLGKAVKKMSKAPQSKQAELTEKISTTAAKVLDRKQNIQNVKDTLSQQPVSSAPVTDNGVNILPIEPVAQANQNYPDITGMTGNVAAPVSGGGGGGGGDYPSDMPLDEVQDDWNEAAQIGEGENPETETKKGLPAILIVIALIIAAYFIFKK